jgi:BirA family biotin operon repressor/biotin-[acetyl-CoA-carboxylase] ligase
VSDALGSHSWSLNTHHVGRRVLAYESLSSTNDRAAELALDPGADGLVILARQQTAGRGQYGRSWVSPPGAGVWISVILRPPPALRRPVVLTAWAAVAVAEAVQPLVNRQPAIKWPNDVLVRGKKLCGILIEQGAAAVVGVGLNANQSRGDLDGAGLPSATSLADLTGRAWDVDDVARRLIASLDAEYHHATHGELAALESNWKWRVGLLGRQVEVTTVDGRRWTGRLREMGFAAVELEVADGRVVTLVPEEVRAVAELP